ncbi:hypothetical protein [Croceivirga thetidis]|uniref:Uncharacterized protein n=1 Tax=Croceivirga thetidis TaxID=2721623 RepID=A0ABX1GU28_9FLAO|nr:hypothetical protein [Croceivirga thetidis]NKI33139.1 hypothetical protein [Croceivirga thetidis]
MTFNWIYTREADHHQRKRCIDLEYQLRPRIIKFLLEQFDDDEHSDENFAAFHFDVYVETAEVYMAQDTPVNYLNSMADRFDTIFNGAKNLSLA